MADRINWQDINERFPIAGKDNDSQVFRNNFTIIKENWQLTRDLLSALEDNAAVLNGPNDFKGNEILNAVLAHYNKKIDTSRINGELGDVLGDVFINPNDGAVQVIRALRNLRLNFQGWAEDTYYQEIRLLLLTDGGPRRVDLINPDGPMYTNNPDKDDEGNYRNYALPNDVARAVIVDVFTYDAGNTVQAYIYTDYSGFLDDGTVIPPDSGTSLEDIKDILPLPNFYEQEGNKDSITSVVGQPFWEDGDNTKPTNIILISPDDIGNFYVGQKLRIWGASLADPFNNTNNVSIDGFGISAVSYAEGTELEDWGDLEDLDYAKYKLHLIDYDTGRVSDSVEYVDAGDGIQVNLANFSNSNFVNITFNRTDITKGVLVYRSINDGEYRLIDMLGPKQLGSLEAGLQYQDYGPFSYVDHSRKQSILIEAGVVTNKNTANAYVASTGVDLDILLSEAITKFGFVDVIIQEVNNSDPTRPYIVLSESYYFDTEIRIASDDTQKIQEEIDLRNESGVNYLVLNNRSYNISQLTIPNNFLLAGIGERTKIRKLSFSTDNTLSVLRFEDDTTNVTLRDFKIDGNQQNQYLRNDNTNLFENYAVHFPVSDDAILGTGTPTKNIKLVNVYMNNILGGGMYSTYAENIRLESCIFEDQGMDDIYGFSPLVASSSKRIVLDSNTFENFTAAVDVLTSDTGVITGNIIKSCGSGLAVFGSRFLTTSPNTIVGPNNEFIWGPDVYNSEFDSVNISLTRDATFISDVYKYQENGIDFNLTSTIDKPYADLFVKMYPLQKNAEGVESLGAEILFDKQYDIVVPGQSTGLTLNDFLLQDNARGKIIFNPNSEDASGIIVDTVGDTTTIRVKMLDGVFNTTEPLLNESTSDATNTATTVSYIDLSGASPISLFDDSALSREAGEFRWKIENDITDPFFTNVNRLLDNYNTTKLKETNEFSIGLVYQVIFEEYARTVDVQSAQLLDTPQINQLLILPGENWIVSVGDSIRTSGVNGLTINGININTIVGRVVQINQSLDTPQIVVEYEGSIDGSIPGSSVSVQIGAFLATRNSFVLAKGRVQ